MNKRRTLNAVLIILSALILISTVSFLAIHNAARERDLRERIVLKNDAVRLLMEEYNLMSAERKLISDKYDYYSKFGTSMTTLLFQQCARNLYDDVFLKVGRPYKAKAVFTVTDTETVGAEGCITREEYKTLTGAGWTLAVGLPESLPRDFDPAAYFDTVRSNLEREGIPFPKVMVFGRENYSQAIMDVVLKLGGIEAVYFNAKDYHCDLKANTIQTKSDVLYLPYLYTSKRTPIRSGYELSMKNGECVSISTRGIRNEMRGDIATHDITQGMLKDLVMTIKNDNSFYRSYEDYRSERLKADTEYAAVLDGISRELNDLIYRIRTLNRTIINTYAIGTDGAKASLPSAPGEEPT